MTTSPIVPPLALAATALAILLVVTAFPRGVHGEPAPAQARVRTVGVLLFEGAELLDVAGPAEVFIVAQEGRAFRVVLVARTMDPVRAMGGVLLLPQATFDTAPAIDVLVVPGGAMTNVEDSGIAWIRKAAKEAEVTMSVCMGAFLLARAGLLDGVDATTHHWGIEGLRKAAPRARILEGRRFVDTGRLLTTAGVTAGIDGALQVVRRLLGEDAANWTAREWMEYRPEPETPTAKEGN